MQVDERVPDINIGNKTKLDNVVVNLPSFGFGYPGSAGLEENRVGIVIRSGVVLKEEELVQVESMVG